MVMPRSDEQIGELMLWIAAERAQLGRALDALGLLDTAMGAIRILGHRVAVAVYGTVVQVNVDLALPEPEASGPPIVVDEPAEAGR